MKDKIICLVGESGSGKSTLAKLLEKEGFNYIRSYTTRNPRSTDEDSHIFVNYVPEILKYDFISQEQIFKSGIIACTYFDNNYYWATKKQYENKGISIYAIDPPGVTSLKNVVKDAEIIVIYLKTDKEERIKRMLENRDYKSVMSRIENDKITFKLIECNYAIDNNSHIENTLELVKKVIFN